jgi:hypothetical protein
MAKYSYTSRDGRTFNSLEEMDAHHNTLGPAPAQTPGPSYRQVNNLDEHGTPNIRDDVSARVDAAASGTGAPIQLNNATIGPGATPQQIEEAKRMLSYRTDNQADNWSTGDVLKKLAVGGAKAMAGAAIIAGGMTLAGVGWGAGAGAKGAAAGAAKAGAAGAKAGVAETLTGVKTAGTLPINNAIPFTNGPAASAFSTGNVASAAGKGLFARGASKVGDFIKNNKDLVGNVVGGFADAAAAENDHEQSLELLHEKDRMQAAKYGNANPGRTYRGLMPGARPSTGYDSYAGFEYRWDARKQQIVRAPIEQPAS